VDAPPDMLSGEQGITEGSSETRHLSDGADNGFQTISLA
jgi:hypothetical protein